MAEITAKMVGELRERTGLGMMECKKALVEAEGDIKKAEEVLRIKSGNKASKLAGRTAAEGVVATFISADKKTGALIEINCETDFVAKDAGFVAFANTVAQAAAEFFGSDDPGGGQPLLVGQAEAGRMDLGLSVRSSLNFSRRFLLWHGQCCAAGGKPESQ